MRWSKLKQIAESHFAKAVRGHAALHITRYGPGLSATMTRAWRLRCHAEGIATTSQGTPADTE